MVREMTLQVEIKTNYSFGVLVLGGLQVAAARGGKRWQKKRVWTEGASDVEEGVSS